MKDVTRLSRVLSRHISMYLDNRLKDTDINSCLIKYIKVVCRRPGTTLDEMKSFTHVNPSNITRAIDDLVNKGYFEKRENPEDKRSFVIYPLQKATEMFDFLVKIELEATDIAEADFTDEEKQCFETLLEKSVKNVVNDYNKTNEKRD